MPRRKQPIDPLTEAEIRELARQVGYKSMRKAKRRAWTQKDADAALAEYRRLKGLTAPG